MTFDKATYTITFEDTVVPVADWYASEAKDCATSYVHVSTDVVDDGYSLTVVVHGDANVIPIYEQDFHERLPDDATITCDVDIGGGDRDLVRTP